VFGIEEKKCDKLYNKSLFGRHKDSTSMEDVTESPESLKKGDHVVLVDQYHVTCAPLKVKQVKKDDNFVIVEGENETYTHSDPVTYKINTDLGKHAHDLGIFSKHTRAIKVKKPEDNDGFKDYECLDFCPGNFETIADFLCANGVKRASVKKVADRDRYVLRCNGKTSHELNKYAAASQLAVGMHIEGSTALELVENANRSGERRFLVKSAKISVSEPLPEKLLTQDATFGVLEDQPESISLGTKSDAPRHVESRVGDQYQLDGMQVLIETGTPDELYDASQKIQDNSLFDLGVVGSLVKTFDGADMVEQYMPALRQGLDKLGRILFLIYWKPEDFVDSYGSDDMTDIENKLLSSFKQFGELILELMQQFQFEDKVDMNALGNV
jgi:uncharacterized Zn ribbon protein